MSTERRFASKCDSPRVSGIVRMVRWGMVLVLATPLLADAPKRTGKRLTVRARATDAAALRESALPPQTMGLCAQPLVNCQIAIQAPVGGSGATGVNSDFNSGARAADNFTVAAPGSITSICWRGFYIDDVLQQPCGAAPPPSQFTVTYYLDSNGFPDQVIGGPFGGINDPGTFTGRVVPTPFGFAQEFEYTATHTPVVAAAGTCYWIEIVNDTAPGSCFWIWETSPDGDGGSLHDFDFNYSPDDARDFDLAFCLNLELGDAGICPPPGGGGGPGGGICLYGDPRRQTPFDPTGTGAGLGRSPRLDHLCRVTDNPVAGVTEVPGVAAGPPTSPGGSVDPLDKIGTGKSVPPPWEETPDEDTPDDEKTPPDEPRSGGCEPPNMTPPAEAVSALNYISPLQVSTGSLAPAGLRGDAGAVELCNALDLGLGVGWNFSYAVVIFDQPVNEFKLYARDSSVTVFRDDGFGGWFPTTGSEFQFDVVGPTCVVATHKSGTSYLFNQGNLNVNLPGQPFLLSAVTDRNGRTVNYNYAGGNLANMVDAEGRQINFTHYPDGHIQSITDQLGRQLQFEYVSDDLTAIILPDTSRIEYTYTPNHEMMSKKIPTGEVYNIIYGPNFRQLRDPLGNDVLTVQNTGWAVDAFQSQLTGELSFVPGVADITTGTGAVWQYEYDPLGQITAIIDPDLNGILVDWDFAARKISSITNQIGDTTTYEYDFLGNLTLHVDAESNGTQMTYDPQFSRMTTWLEPDGDLWTYIYDTSGNLLRIIDPLIEVPDLVTEYTYDPAGQLTTATDRNGTATRFTWIDGLPATQVTDDGGFNLTRTYAYDAMGRLTRETDPTGMVTTYEHDFLNNITLRTVDAGTGGLNLVDTFEYDPNGRVVRQVDPLGTETVLEYDERDRLFRLTRDAATGGLALVTEYGYDGNDNRVAELDAEGGLTLTEFDGLDRLVMVTDPELHETTFEYDAAGNRTLAIDDDARTVSYTYDSLGRLLTETKDPGGLDLTTSLDYAGAGCGCGTPGQFTRRREEDPDGRVTYRYFDSFDRLTRVVRKFGDTTDNGGDADDAITDVEYDPTGAVLSVTERNAPEADRVYSFTYDAIGRVTALTQDPGSLDLTTTYEYDGMSRLTRQTEPSGNVVIYGFDSIGRRTSITDNLGTAITQTYDANGNLLTVTDGDSNGMTLTYDALNRKISETDARGETATFDYDAIDRVTLQTNRKGQTSRFEYDEADNLVRRFNDLSEPDPLRSYTYDARGNILSLTDHNASSTTYAYDSIGRLTRQTYPDTNSATFGYAGTDQPTSRTDQNGDVTTLTYDELDRLVSRTYAAAPGSPAAVTPDATFEYDRLGNLTTADNAESDVDYAYDALGRLTQINQDGKTTTIAQVYLPTGSERSLTYPGGLTLAEAYDVRDRLTQVSDGSPITTLAYDAAGRLTSRTNATNGTSTSYTLDGNGWITSLVGTNDDGPFVDLDYGRDAEGNPTFLRKNHDPVNSELYGYDGLDRLVNFERGALNPAGSAIIAPSPAVGPLQSQSWPQLDLLGNWLATTQISSDGASTGTRSVRPDNAYDVIDNRVQTYDAKGQLLVDAAPGDADGDGDIDEDDLAVFIGCLDGPVPTSGLSPTCQLMDFDADTNVDLEDYSLFAQVYSGGDVLANGARRLTYDIESRLVRVEIGGETTVEYAYDAMNRRVGRRVGTDETRYYYDDRMRVIEERDGIDAVTATYVYGTWVDEVLTMDRSGQRVVYHRDAQGSIVALTDANGDVVERYLYDAYGRPSILDGAGTTLPDSAFDNPYLYTGRRFDPETGYYHYRSRTYDPLAGRFVQRDLKDYVDGDNLYQYVSSRPLALVDPWGFAGTGRTCVGITKTPISLSKSGSIGPVSWSASLKVEIGGKVCARCCPLGTPRACSWVIDNVLEVSLSGSASASASSYGGKVGPLSFWAGIKVSAGISGSAKGTLESDRCNNVELQGRFCVSANGTVSVSGGASVSLKTWVRTFRLGADITGTGSISLDKCLTCSAAGCRWQRGKVCLSGSADLNVSAVVISGRWNIWRGRRCWPI